MPRNTYISLGTQSEQSLYEDLIIESLKIYGHDIYYLPRHVVSIDTIFTEDIQSKYGAAFKLEAYLENVDGFEGDGTLMSKYGLEIRDAMTLVMSKRRWEKLVGRYKTTNSVLRPCEGDLVYFPTASILMEVKYVENKKPFYQLQNLPVYTLKLEAFEYTGEKLETGVVEIDGLEATKNVSVNLTLSSLVGKFYPGEKITQTLSPSISIEAIVVEQSAIGTTLTVTSIASTDGLSRKFTGAIIGEKSGATATVTSTETLEAIQVNDPSAQNGIFEDEGNAIIDFSENNPFGSVNTET